MKTLPDLYDLNLWNTDILGLPNADGEPRWKVALYHYDPLTRYRASDSQLIVAFPVQPPTEDYPEDHFYTEGEDLPDWLRTVTLEHLNQKVTA